MDLSASNSGLGEEEGEREGTGEWTGERWDATPL